ncbi:MAG TPA: fumarylacetoacetate hydrolase family protein [Bauldia sp.]|nr:fumarylacetoacetate hydrolase family protein [Bauldia sp.]
MKLVTFVLDKRARVGALIGDSVVDLTAGGVADTMLDLIAGGEAALARARRVADGGESTRRPLAAVGLLAPIPQPGKVLCCGINYRSHAAENPKAVMPQDPFFFAKLPTSVIGPDAPIIIPPMSRQVDYEVEFAVVIGKRLSRADTAEVMPAIFGYTLLNDVSARDVQFKEAQITIGKNFDGFAPIGPCITTADELRHPESTRLTTRLNGKVMQDGNTSDWVFPLTHVVSFLSQIMTLEPGDIISTGTPAGVGYFRNPQVFMKAGDLIEIEGEGIGVLRNRVVA